MLAYQAEPINNKGAEEWLGGKGVAGSTRQFTVGAGPLVETGADVTCKA